jgi:hypothetical protein
MSNTIQLALVLLGAFAVIVVVGLIVDKRKTWQILQWILIGIGVVLLGWLAVKFKVNIGKYVNNFIGKRKKMPGSIIDDTGESLGEVITIVKKKNPIRDRGVIETSNGTQITLPKGVMDTDVEKVTRVGSNKYTVEVRHNALTDIFDTNSSD